MSNETRGTGIKRRRLALGIKSVHEFARETGVSRKAVTAAEEDAASPATYDRLEVWLDSAESGILSEAEESGSVGESTLVTFELRGVFGAESVTVKGPIENLDELEAAVEKLLRPRGGE